MTPLSKMEVFKPTLRVCESNLWAPQFLQWILNLLQSLKTAKKHALKHFLVIFCDFFVVFSCFWFPYMNRGFPKHTFLVHVNQHKTLGSGTWNGHGINALSSYFSQATITSVWQFVVRVVDAIEAISNPKAMLMVAFMKQRRWHKGFDSPENSVFCGGLKVS